MGRGRFLYSLICSRMKSVNGYTLFIKRKAKEIIIAEGEVFPIISCLFPFACLEVKKNVLVSWTCELLNLLVYAIILAQAIRIWLASSRCFSIKNSMLFRISDLYLCGLFGVDSFALLRTWTRNVRVQAGANWLVILSLLVCPAVSIYAQLAKCTCQASEHITSNSSQVYSSTCVVGNWLCSYIEHLAMCPGSRWFMLTAYLLGLVI